MTGTVEIIVGADNADGYEERLVTLPIRFEVCSNCCGQGTTVNPSVDGDGWTREMFDEDPEFEESYFRGDYDVTCPSCHGANIEALPDEGRMNATQKEAWNIYCENAHDRHVSYLESQAERRMGA
jgi:hypothetical protein